ncbi:MAG: 2-oxoacid:ferredoxin oxidoreductase subunit beta [Candidatus Omnitrophota bacterium]
MKDINLFKSNDEITWCPGCGNFGILNAIKKTLVKLDKQPNEILLVSGIGQAAKLPHYINCNCFNGLHGRALPVAAAAKIANRKLTVIVTTGDGDCYGEGGNHFIHNIRRNVDITVIVHNNQIYGLTKGQASPTTDIGYITKVQTQGVVIEPFHSLAVAIVLGCGFVARGYSGNSDELSELILAGINHKGLSLIEVLQPCISFNKKNTHQWYSERIYKLAEDSQYDTSDKFLAIKRAIEWDGRIPTGIFYKKEDKTYEDNINLNSRPALVETQMDVSNISKNLLDSLSLD